MNADEARRTIELFQEAALAPELWPEALAAMASAFGSTGVMAQMIGDGGYALLVSPSLEEGIDAFLKGEWHMRNPRMARGLELTRAGRRGFITEYHMFSPDELARDAYQQEFAPRHGADAEAGLLVATHQGSGFVLTAPRSYRIGPYSTDELEQMNRLGASLVETCSFALRMKLAHAGNLVDTFSARGEAMALLSPNGSSLFHTAAFERLLGERIVLRAGRVHVADPSADAELQALIARTARWPEPTALELMSVVIPRPFGRPLIVRCNPVAGAARDFLGLARTILVVDDLALMPPPPQPELLARAFGLTASEARLATRIAVGEELRAAAESEKITYESARTRLKKVFHKTGVDRQTELALLLSRLG